MTVSIDGVLFVDGVFVGPDTRNFFRSLNAKFEGRREALAEFARALNGDSEAIKNFEALSNHGVIKVPSEEVSEKLRVKRQLAVFTMAARKRLGDKVVLERINAELSKPLIHLRKLPSDSNQR